MSSRIRSRNGDLNRQFMLTLAKRQRWPKEDNAIAMQKQIEFLYNGDLSLWELKKCIYCPATGCNRNDHLISLIAPGGVPSMYGNHPFNMVHCCRSCNNEVRKRRCIESNNALRLYFEFVKENCPRLPYVIDHILHFFADFKTKCMEWDLGAMHLTEVEDILN